MKKSDLDRPGIVKQRLLHVIRLKQMINDNVKLREQSRTVPEVELLLLLEELLLTTTTETFSDLAVSLSVLLAAEEEDGKEDVFVADEEEEEEEDEEALDGDEEELLDQAALDSSPKGFPSTGVSARMEGAACSLWPSPRVCRLCGPTKAAGVLGIIGRPPPLASVGLHSAPTSVKVPVIILAPAKTLPSVPTRTPASVSVQTAPASENTLPSSITALSLAPALTPDQGMGTAGSRGRTARLTFPW